MKPAKGQYRRNLSLAGEAFGQLAADPPDLVVLPEAALTGYFLEGAVYDVAVGAEAFARDLAQTWRAAGGERVDLAAGFFENDGGTYYNSAIYVEIEATSERIVHLHRKMFLPTYGVFDEERFLSRGHKLGVFATRFGTMSLLICEDAWHAIVPAIAAIKGARIVVVPSASPGRGIESDAGELESVAHWRDILRVVAIEHGIFVVYAGLTGFEGGKGMSGSSCVVDPRGNVLVQAPAGEPCIVRADLDLREIDLARARLPLLGDLESALPDLLLDEELPLPRHRAESV
ncbi:MAG: beta-ureidopropionase [Candidatus Eremiobacteraeota bacterium]|nr:beta-ureidopropionase [Candidatus Eremiobacteraeota bacterium]